MGNTYAMVNERKKEWLRQWAKIMLIIEQSVSREETKQSKSFFVIEIIIYRQKKKKYGARASIA